MVKYTEMEAGKVINSDVQKLRWSGSSAFVFDFSDDIIFRFDVEAQEWYFESAKEGVIIAPRDEEYYLHVDKINWDALKHMTHK